MRGVLSRDSGRKKPRRLAQEAPWLRPKISEQQAKDTPCPLRLYKSQLFANMGCSAQISKAARACPHRRVLGNGSKVRCVPAHPLALERIHDYLQRCSKSLRGGDGAPMRKPVAQPFWKAL
jgi:hypothetical protein